MILVILIQTYRSRKTVRSIDELRQSNINNYGTDILKASNLMDESFLTSNEEEDDVTSIGSKEIHEEGFDFGQSSGNTQLGSLDYSMNMNSKKSSGRNHRRKKKKRYKARSEQEISGVAGNMYIQEK